MSIFFSGNTYNFGATVSARIGTGTTSYVFSGLSSGSTYGFIIWAFNSFGPSSIIGPSVNLTKDLTVPEDFSVSQFGETSVILNWKYDPTILIDGFQILRGNSPLTGLTFVANDIRGFIDSGLTKGLTYTYDIQARAFGSFSKPILRQKSLPASPSVPEPSEPIGFTLSINSNDPGTIVLNWNKGELGFYGEPDGYQIYRSLTDSNYKIVASTTGATNYSDNGSFVFGNTYFYKIQAYNSGGPSSLTGPKFIRVLGPGPTAPSGLTAYDIQSDNFILGWNDNSTNENIFKIYYRT